MNDTTAARVEALESLLVEKGIVDSSVVDKVVGDWETFRKRLIANIAEDDARPYWQSWASALEDVLESGAVLARGEVDDRHQELLSRPAGFDHHA